jgi:sugar phosphate isomerase/epimerase
LVGGIGFRRRCRGWFRSSFGGRSGPVAAVPQPVPAIARKKIFRASEGFPPEIARFRLPKIPGPRLHGFPRIAIVQWTLALDTAGRPPHYRPMHLPFRRFAAALGVAAVVQISSLAAGLVDQVGIQTWTLRKLKFEQVVEFAKAQGITELQMIGDHMNPKAPLEETLKKKAILDAAGLHVYTFGVAGTSLDKEDNRKLFEFAKVMGIRVIVVEPGDFRIWDNLEALAKEYDIKVAVHNHGIKSLYGNPAIVKQIIKDRDPRIGVCLDVGWITSSNFDAAKVFKEYNGRVFDIHLKDKVVKKTEKGDDVAFDTNIGEGQSNYKDLFKVLKETGYQGRLAIETDSDDFARKPDDFVRKAKEFVAANDPATR